MFLDDVFEQGACRRIQLGGGRFLADFLLESAGHEVKALSDNRIEHRGGPSDGGGRSDRSKFELIPREREGAGSISIAGVSRHIRKSVGVEIEGPAFDGLPWFAGFKLINDVSQHLAEED